MRSSEHDWNQLATWLKANAPRTHATLLPPIPAKELVSQLGPNLPREMIELYGYVGGQSSDAPKNTAGIFRGYWMMPLAGVDGLKAAFENWETLAENGVEWATPNRFPFAKDFGGSYLCFEVPPLDPDDDPDDVPDAKIVQIEDGESEELYDDLSSFLYCTRINLEEKTVVIDERLEERDVRVVLFDATRARKVGDFAKHSVFEEFGITAVVCDIADVASGDEPKARHGLMVRLTANERIDIDDVQLVDANDRPLRANVGRRRGGGMPGQAVWAVGQHPLPAASRLKVTLARVRMVP